MQLNKKYPIGTGTRIDLTECHRNNRILVDVESKTAERTHDKQYAISKNLMEYDGKARILSPNQAVRTYPHYFTSSSVRLPVNETVIHIKLDEATAAYVRTKPNITEYVRNLIQNDIANNKVR